MGGQLWWLSVLLIAATTVDIAFGQAMKTLRTLGEWRDLEYDFETAANRKYAIDQKLYIPGNGIPIDIDVDYNKGMGMSRVFVTIPRFQVGVPITLGVLTGRNGTNGPMIAAYPTYAWQSSNGTNCNGITSVFRVAIDDCRRLWVLDTGSIAGEQKCPPQLLAFDLNNYDALVHRHVLPDEFVRRGASLFVTPVVDVRGPTCQNTMVYMADVNGFAIIVYDVARGRSWRVHNKYVYPHPYYGTFKIAGESFELMDGVLGMAVSPKSLRTERSLYFHALTGISENKVPLSVLDNEAAWRDNPDASPRSFVEIGTRGTPSAAQAMDSNGNLWFGLMDPIAIACWDSTQPYGRSTIRVISQNDQTLQFASGVKVVMNTYKQEELFVLTCRFQRLMTGTMNFREVNFRIMALPVADLLNGQSRCVTPGKAASSFAFPK